jgi:hypothetical protein
VTFSNPERAAGAYAGPVRNLVGQLRVCQALARGLLLSVVACNGGGGPTVSPQPTANGSAPAATGTAPTPKLDATGILLVSAGEQVQGAPPSEDFAVALSDAMQLAEANGTDIGYPWIDPSNGVLLLSAVTPRGRDLLQVASFSVPHHIRDVVHGATELRRIQDEATFLRSQGVAGAELIYATSPDQRDNRALIVISAMSRPLLEYLVGHYPADALAVEMRPIGPSKT